VLRQSHEAPRYSVFSSLLSLPAPNILLSTLFSDRLCLCSSIIAKDQVILPYKTGQVIVLYILIWFWYRKVQAVSFPACKWLDTVLNNLCCFITVHLFLIRVLKTSVIGTITLRKPGSSP
jgi:hypothetical protein